ncbi:MAG: Caulobacter phage CcrColossus [Fibrobacterota bacterium]
MNSTQFAAHEFSVLEEAGFDPCDYSRLKFGSNQVASRFGREMAEKFLAQHREMLATREVLVLPSAYNMLEIAASLLARQFLRHLNVLLVREGLPIVKWSVMHRTISYFSDYAKMSRQERRTMLEGDSFFINKDYIRGKVLLFVDDVIITGAHEEKIRAFLAREGISNEHLFLYFAKYTGDQPDVESRLNTSGVNCAETYLSLIHEPGHQIIVRTCKFLLNGSSRQLETVLARSPESFAHDLLSACIMEEYHNVPGYRENMEILTRAVR